MSVEVFKLAEIHRSDWQPLAEGYEAFYKTPTTAQEYDQAWARLMAADPVHGLGARLNGQLVGTFMTLELTRTDHGTLPRVG